MSLVALDAEGMAIRRRRLLIFGDPNVGKTRSLLTLPEPRVVVSSPGEKGHDTLYGAKNTHAFRWQPDEKQDSHAVLQTLRKQCIELIAGKCGPINSFAFEGLHKLIGYIMDSVTDGAWFSGGEFEPKIYNLGYRMFDDFLSKLSNTGIPVTAFTCWAEREPDRPKRPGERASDIPAFIRPALPGKLAKQIEGEFSVSVYQYLGKLKPTEEVRGLWQTRPGGEVKGCALKGPKEIVDRIPAHIDGSYQVLEQLWSNAEKEGSK